MQNSTESSRNQRQRSGAAVQCALQSMTSPIVVIRHFLNSIVEEQCYFPTTHFVISKFRARNSTQAAVYSECLRHRDAF